MPIEVKMLVWALVLLFVLILIQVMTTVLGRGLIPAVGNREDFPANKPGFAGRLDRAVNNLKEGLIFFIPIVILAAIFQVSNEMTATGAMLFTGARVGHAVVYMAGIPWIRTLLFLASVAGLGMMLLGLGLPGALFA